MQPEGSEMQGKETSDKANDNWSEWRVQDRAMVMWWKKDTILNFGSRIGRTWLLTICEARKNSRMIYLQVIIVLV